MHTQEDGDDKEHGIITIIVVFSNSNIWHKHIKKEKRRRGNVEEYKLVIVN